MVFIDLEKAYDRALTNLIWKVLKAKEGPKLYIDLIKDMYTNARTCIKILIGKIEDFSVKVGLHMGSTLSPYLFTFVMDELTYNILDDALWYEH